MTTIKAVYPDHNELKTEFVCKSCKSTFKGGDIVLEPLPSNMKVCGSGGYRMGCPKCEYRTFMGFDLAVTEGA